MQNKLVTLTDRQYRLLPIVSAHYDLQSSNAVVRAAVDALIATLAEQDAIFRTSVLISDTTAETGIMPDRLNLTA